MDLFVNGKLDPQRFDVAIRQATQDFAALIVAAAQTQSQLVETTHFLMVMADIPNGVTQKALKCLQLSVDEWRSGLGGCAHRTPDSLPPAHLTRDTLHDTTMAMLESAATRCAQAQQARIGEAVLLLSALENVTDAVREQFAGADIALDQWRHEIEESLRPVKPIPAFDDSGAVLRESLSPSAKRVLHLLQSEAESLGYPTADPRHLLLALLLYGAGATAYVLHHQGIPSHKLQESVMLSLRTRTKQTRSDLFLDRHHLQPTLQHILTLAGKIAGQDRVERISESHLLRAFLTTESVARHILEDEKIDLVVANDIAERQIPIEADEAEEFSIADINTVRERLRGRLVGQDEAIERVLPYVQRMRFGFSTPGRPVSVFLFCGQSGSGKTEMAKELARSVFGSEEKLIFLEMGQFNAPESMNIFVGAPPGYVGYGEGKLTNGLRDKPQAVVLFDEVEKAHARVLDALLRFIDEGRIDDPAGPVRDGSQCMVVLTSNVAAEELGALWREVEASPNWRTLLRQRLREEFKQRRFRVEFLNRVDELVLFRSLRVEDYIEIATRLLQRDLLRLRTERQIEVRADPSVAEAIGQYCAAINEGARAAQRLTQSVVVTPVIDFLLQNACTPPVRLTVSAVTLGDEVVAEPSGVVAFAE